MRYLFLFICILLTACTNDFAKSSEKFVLIKRTTDTEVYMDLTSLTADKIAFNISYDRVINTLTDNTVKSIRSKNIIDCNTKKIKFGVIELHYDKPFAKGHILETKEPLVKTKLLNTKQLMWCNKLRKNN